MKTILLESLVNKDLSITFIIKGLPLISPPDIVFIFLSEIFNSSNDEIPTVFKKISNLLSLDKER